VYFAHLARSEQVPEGVIGATRGNHGQSVGYAARRYGIPATIVVPYGNSVEKNAAMRSLGVELIEHGDEQHAAVAEILAEAGWVNIDVTNDLAGIPRVTTAVR
jgi:threonine dehydratase